MKTPVETPVKTPVKTPEKIAPFSREYRALIHSKQQRATVEATGPATPEVTTEGTTEVTSAQPESRPESQPESLAQRVMELLAGGARSKVEIATGLGHRGISGQLNKVIRLLLQEQVVAHTIPDKPNSRLQKYVLTKEGMTRLETLRTGRISR